MPKSSPTRKSTQRGPFPSASTLQHMLSMIQFIEGQTNSRASALIGISTFLIALIVPRFVIGDQLSLSIRNAGWALMCLGALLAIVNAVFVFKPTVHNARKVVNLFYPGSYLRRLSREEYIKRLPALFDSEAQYQEAFAAELYDYGQVVISSTKHLERAIVLFAFDVIAGGILLIAQLFVNK